MSAPSPVLKEDTTVANGMKPPPPKAANISRKRKSVQSAVDTLPNGSYEAPLTPKRKKTSKAIPPITPTPSAIGLMTMPYSSGDVDDNTPPPALNRLATLGHTNAPLVTPETHRLLVHPALDQVSPSKAAVAKTTECILDDALAHLIATEPKLKSVIEKHPCRVFSPEGLSEEIDPFRSLASGIISQQVRD